VPPTIWGGATTAPNGNGWYAGNVVVHFTCSDSGAGLAAGACPADQVLIGEGSAVSSTSATVTDLAGNTSGASNVVTVAIDRTDPSVSATAASSPNGNGWYAGDVVVAITCADAGDGSGLAAGACPADQLLTGEGASISSTPVTVTDRADRVSAASDVVTVAIDRTAPVVTASATTPPNGNGWYAGDVVVHFTCTDGGSGIDSCPADQVLTGEGAAVSSAAVTVTDLAGNVSAPSNVVTVAIDRTKPVVSFTPSGPTSYGLLDTVAIACSATDALSGIASSSCPSTSGPAWSFGPGLHARSASATDRAGNSASASTSFTVTATADSLCDLVRAFTDHNGTRTSLCAHLTNFERSRSRGQSGPAAAQLESFRKEATSRIGKPLTAAQVAVLIGWANTL
jgi:hypothetical protein